MQAKCESKAQRSSLDIFSTLPETIIETILCLLPIEDAARTSILSRKWRYRWTKIPKLVFSWRTVPEGTTKEKQTHDITSARKNMDRRCKLFYAILQVLLLRQGPIHEFALDMDATPECFEIDQIILHLSRNHTIKKLTLEADASDGYRLPLCAFSLHQLTDLSLDCINLDYQPVFSGFGSLKNLYLNDVTISTKPLLHLLSNCPSLKSLTLTAYSAPGSKDCTITELFECLPMIEHLTTRGDVVNPWLVVDLVPKELIHLNYFCFNDICFADDHGLTFLTALVKRSPNLEKITLEIDENHTCCENGASSAILEQDSDVWLEHLNELEIAGFSNYKPEMEFVKLILARSPKLKKVRIDSVAEDDQEVKMLKTLLRAPRASPVEIIIE